MVPVQELAPFFHRYSEDFGRQINVSPAFLHTVICPAASAKRRALGNWPPFFPHPQSPPALMGRERAQPVSRMFSENVPGLWVHHTCRKKQFSSCSTDPSVWPIPCGIPLLCRPGPDNTSSLAPEPRTCSSYYSGT